MAKSQVHYGYVTSAISSSPSIDQISPSNGIGSVGEIRESDQFQEPSHAMLLTTFGGQCPKLATFPNPSHTPYGTGRGYSVYQLTKGYCPQVGRICALVTSFEGQCSVLQITLRDTFRNWSLIDEDELRGGAEMYTNNAAKALDCGGRNLLRDIRNEQISESAFPKCCLDDIG